MSEFSGHLQKMAARAVPSEAGADRCANSGADTVQYDLILDQQAIPLTPLIGKTIRLEYVGDIHCCHCGRKSKKSFGQGYCYPCFSKLAQCDSCMMSPEKCHFHLGTCREPEWAKQVCFNEHIVYLANSSGIKVGITRATQVPTRWLDQGATQALPIARVATRKQSGLIEDCLRQDIADKTNWRAMLKGNAEAVDLEAERDRLFDLFSPQLNSIIANENPGDIELLYESDAYAFNFPVEQFPTKITSFNLDKNPLVEGCLKGIKGQYLLLDTGVINIRKFTSYSVSVSFF
ncbi:DUF2797 domain-containing protein [Bacterioplanoides sp. SCSIO 12839]|uniref:DUF2797 domain-containing protein n=1 Tax=Bacterioplanoides sp. SCSIO 12839 TaxID=2829569 RepID=UPI002102B285|nr:DUF2797 domain-containing protein [Bacterioplanoides sp. SCSIO 12839]UTW49450.1 DUF2797 domain-containing protein [Bacterioplanoides sp. SCSIO 12839]